MNNVDSILRENLLTICHAFSKATGKSMEAISRKYHGTFTFLGNYKSGKSSVQTNTYQAIIDKIMVDWPEGTPKPTVSAIMPSVFINAQKPDNDDGVRERVRR